MSNTSYHSVSEKPPIQIWKRDEKNRDNCFGAREENYLSRRASKAELLHLTTANKSPRKG
jgi:hypothetical protein